MPSLRPVYATVTSTSPLRVTVDGSTTPIPAKNYFSLPLAPGQRVQVEGAPPADPLITAILTTAAPTAGATLLNQSILAAASASFDVADVLAANSGGDAFVPSGWTFFGHPEFTLPDDGGIVVDFDAYEGGSAVQLAAGIVSYGSPTTDRYLLVHATSLGNGVNPVMPLFPTLDNSFASGMGYADVSQVPGLSPTVQSALGYAVPLSSAPYGFKVAVSDPTAAATGTLVIAVALYALIPSDTYTDPQLV